MTTFFALMLACSSSPEGGDPADSRIHLSPSVVDVGVVEMGQFVGYQLTLDRIGGTGPVDFQVEAVPLEGSGFDLTVEGSLDTGASLAIQGDFQATSEGPHRARMEAWLDTGEGMVLDSDALLRAWVPLSDCRTEDVDCDGFTTDEGDCDDTNVWVRPGAADDCDDLDNNCDGQVDETCDHNVG